MYMEGKLYQLLSYFDILSYKPEIKIKGRSRFITTFGIILGCMSIFSVIILSFIFFMDIISRTKFSLVYNLDSRLTPKVSLKNNQIALLLINAVGQEFLDYEKIYSFSVKYWRIDLSTKIESNYTSSYNSYAPKNTIIDIPLKNCTALSNLKFKEFYGTFSFVYRSGVCLDFSGFNDTLFGKYGGVEGYSTLNIYINKCVNSTASNKTDCYSEDVIDKKLAQSYINLVSIENDIDSNNFEKPFEPFVKNDILPISSTIFKNYFKDMNYIIFNSDNNFLLETKDTYEGYRTDKIVESVDLRGSNTLFQGTFSQITFRCSGKTEIFLRSYIKIPATLSYIGGIVQAITFIGRLLLYLSSRNSMQSYLIMNIFNFDEINNTFSMRIKEKKFDLFKFGNVNREKFYHNPKSYCVSNNDVKNVNSTYKIAKLNENKATIKFTNDQSDIRNINHETQNKNYDNNLEQNNHKNENKINNDADANDIRQKSNSINMNSNFNHTKNFNLKNNFNTNNNDGEININKQKSYNQKDGFSSVLDNCVNNSKDKFFDNYKTNNNNVKRNFNYENENYEQLKLNDNINNAHCSNLNIQVNKPYNNNNYNTNSKLHPENKNENMSNAYDINKNQAIFNSLKRAEDKFVYLKRSLTKSKYKKVPSLFNFWELICVKELICIEKKRQFLNIASDIIDRKISLEHTLKLNSSFEKLKDFLLNKEQRSEFIAIPNLKIDQHLKEINDLDIFFEKITYE